MISEAGGIPTGCGQRQREVRALIEGEGRCQSLYDVERRRMMEVPLEYEWHIKAVLDSGGGDETLRSWLAEQEILTFDEPPHPQPMTERFDPRAAGEDLGWISLENGVVHCRLPSPELPKPLLSSEYLGAPGAVVIFHLALDRVTDSAALERCFERGLTWGDEWRRQVVFQLSGHRRDLSMLPLDRRADRAIRLYLLGCPAAREDGSLRHPEGEAITAQIRRLAGLMGERLTVHAELAAADRLRDLWAWAGATGVSRLDATRVEEHRDPTDLGLSAGAREYGGDLQRACDEIFQSHLESGRAPVYFLPLLRAVQKQRTAAAAAEHPPAVVALLRRHRPVRFQAGLRGVQPLQRSVSSGGGARPEVAPAEARSEDPCSSCWARHLCAASAFAGPAEAERSRPRTDRCDAWKLEVEAGLRLYARLRAADPEGFLDFPSTPGLTPGLAPPATESTGQWWLDALTDPYPVS